MNFIKIFNYILGILFILLAAISYYFVIKDIISINTYTLLISFSIAIAIFFIQVGRSLRVESTIDKLAKVPDLEKMIEQARTQEEKIKVLKNEKENLLEYIKIESRRMFIIKRLDDLDERLKEGYKVLTPILDEINILEKELMEINDSYSTSISLKEIENIRARIEGKINKITIGKTEFEITTGFPIFDEIIGEYVKILKHIFK